MYCNASSLSYLFRGFTSLELGMKTILLNELIIYLVLFALLSLGIHNDLLHTPLDRIALMQEHNAYLHPFIYTTVVYLVFGVIRLSIIGVKRFKLR